MPRKPAPSKSPAPATHIALLRGINVGGNNMLPMPRLAALFEAAGCESVRTYIQSGNVLFRAKKPVAAALERKLPALIAKSFGFTPPVLVRTAAELAEAIAGNPFPKAAAGDPRLLHVGFLAGFPAPTRTAALDPARSPGDSFALQGRTLYLHTPRGVLETRCTYAWFESTLKTPVTFRNWRTVLKLAELATAD